MRTTRTITVTFILLLQIAVVGRGQERQAVEAPEQENIGNHTELGVTVGTPSFLNLVAGQWFNQWGFRASGMTYGANMRGIFLYAGFEFIRDGSHRHCFGLMGGTWHYTHNDWRFLGPAYDLYIGGFFMEFGIGWGKGTYMANQVNWQIGYTHTIFGK